MPSLTGKVVIVTGASSGIGASSAVLFAREGCKVALVARRLDKLDDLVNKIRNEGGQALPLMTDISQPVQIEAMVRSVQDAYGRIDILFNNAGFGRLDWLEKFDPITEIQAQITVDLLGVIWTARSVIPIMYKQQSGHIINMCSMAGWAAPPLYSIYSAAKFGVRGFSEALRRESKPFGVNVSVIYPGGVASEFESHIGDNPAKKRFKTPDWLKLTAEDVARSVISLARRPRSHLITPWWMLFSKLLNSHFNGISDSIQARAFKPYHQL